MKTCKSCGKEKPYTDFNKKSDSKDGYATVCKACKKIKDKDYYEQNKSKILERASEYRENNQEKISNYKKDYYGKEENILKKKESNLNYRQDNKDQISQKKKEYRELNIEAIKKSQRRYYEDNSEDIKQKARNRYAENPEPFKINSKNRKARKKFADGRFYQQDINKLYYLQRGMCVYCEQDLSLGYHVDHIMPLILGGSNWPENLQLLCPTCNLRKHAKDPFVWANELGKLL